MSKARQAAVDAYQEADTVKGAARLLGLSPKTVREHLKKAGVLKPQASSLLEPGADNNLKKTSTLVDASGNVKQQWVICEREKGSNQEALKVLADSLLGPIKGKSKAPRRIGRGKVDPSIQPWVVLGDEHFGLLSWAPETGSNFDTDINEKVMTEAVDRLVRRTKPAKKCVICSVGDTLHANGPRPLTPGGGNVLDVDSRYRRVIEVASRAFKHCIETALEIHETVHVVIVPGNHDPDACFVLSYGLDQYYANDPRVTVDMAPTVRRYYRFGKNLIGVTHGDKAKRSKLPDIMANERRKDWGETINQFWFLGHIHHQVREDIGTVQLEHFRTLASADAWHTEQGYLSIKDARCIVLHETYGEIERYTVGTIQLSELAS